MQVHYGQSGVPSTAQHRAHQPGLKVREHPHRLRRSPAASCTNPLTWFAPPNRRWCWTKAVLDFTVGRHGLAGRVHPQAICGLPLGEAEVVHGLPRPSTRAASCAIVCLNAPLRGDPGLGMNSPSEQNGLVAVVALPHRARVPHVPPPPGGRNPSLSKNTRIWRRSSPAPASMTGVGRDSRGDDARRLQLACTSGTPLRRDPHVLNPHRQGCSAAILLRAQ
jgi:hypothetical protein